VCEQVSVPTSTYVVEYCSIFCSRQGIALGPYATVVRDSTAPASCIQSFWLSWVDGILKSGVGNVVGNQTYGIWEVPAANLTAINRMKVVVNSGNWSWSFPNRFYISGNSISA